MTPPHDAPHDGRDDAGTRGWRLGTAHMTSLPDGAPTQRTFTEVAADILSRHPRRGRTRVVAVDGGSAAGKSTFAARLASALDGIEEANRRVSVVHTDDVAWHESFFGWWPLLVSGVLDPLATGPVRYRPPAWDARGRLGAIQVEPGTAAVIEGVGAARRELSPFLDYVVWIDTNRQTAVRRGLAREGEDPDFWREWEVAEEAHLDRDRPWERADLIVSNDAPGPDDPDRHLLVTSRSTWRREDRPG